jgi:hypothetical protein
MFVKLLGAILLASLLAVLAYAGFWVAAVKYAETQIKSTVGGALGADVEYTRMVWVPAVNNVAMRLISPRITFRDGPVKELTAQEIIVESGFLARGHWQLRLPSHSEATLANGRKLNLETGDGRVVWLDESQSLSLRAQSLRIQDSANPQPFLQVNDVILEHRPSDDGVRINLASRPVVGNERGAQLSGNLILPYGVFGDVLSFMGTSQSLPDMGQIFQVIARSMQSRGGILKLENISYKRQQGEGAGFNGALQVDAAGKLSGELMVTADKVGMLKNWVEQSGLLDGQKAGYLHIWNRLITTLEDDHPSLNLKAQRENVLANGVTIATRPVAQYIVAHLW